MTDLDRLIAAVEAGGPWGNVTSHLAARALDLPPNMVSDNYEAIEGAYNGSLDAAHRLHDALLPGWGWTLECADAAEVWPLGKLKLAIRSYSDGGTPARAWLLAIFRALKEKGQ